MDSESAFYIVKNATNGHAGGGIIWQIEGGYTDQLTSTNFLHLPRLTSLIMPKNQKQQSSSSKSDNGPEDQNQPASKKAKETPAVKAGKSASKGSRGDGPWVLKKLRQVRINEVRGRKTVDIGDHYEKNGKIVRGKDSISLSIQQWKELLEVADEITRAVKN